MFVTYAIQHLCHRTDISMGAHGFAIDLHPSTCDAVKASGLDQQKIEVWLERMGRTWLDAAGFDAIFDPDNCGAWADKAQPPGPEAHPMYRPNFDLGVSWGEWGPEHISVPGNACGLDIERRAFGCMYSKGAQLVPHNVDSLTQKYLLLIVFTEIVNCIHYSNPPAESEVPT